MFLSYPDPTVLETVLQRYQLPLTALRHLRNARSIRLNGNDSVDQQLRIGDGECYLESRIRAVMMRVYSTASPGEMTWMKTLLTCNASIERLLATATEEGFVVGDWKAMNALVYVEDPQGLEILLEEIFAPDLFAAAEAALHAEPQAETDAGDEDVVQEGGEDENDFRAYQEASKHALGTGNASLREHYTSPADESFAKVSLDSSSTPHFPATMPFTFRSSFPLIPQHAEPNNRFLATPPKPDPLRPIGLAEERTVMNFSAPSMEPQNNWDGRREQITNDRTAPPAAHPGRHVPAQSHFTFPSSLQPPHVDFGRSILCTVPGSTAWEPPKSNATMRSQMMAGSSGSCGVDNNSVYGILSSSTTTPPNVEPSPSCLATPTESAFAFRYSFPCHPEQLELKRSFSFTQP